MPQQLIVGEIYRVPATNEQISIDRYDSILQNLKNFNGDVLLATDQNFNYINTNVHANSLQLLNTFITAGFIPTITKPTRITHTTSTLIDNIYIRSNNHHNLTSGIINTHISDHLPIFMMIGEQIKYLSKSTTIKYRTIKENVVTEMIQQLNTINWNDMDNLGTDEAVES